MRVWVAVFICLSLLMSREGKQNDVLKSVAPEWLPAVGWAGGCGCIQRYSGGAGKETTDGQGCSLWRWFCWAGNTGEKHSFFQLSPFVCFPIRKYVATAAPHFVITTRKNEFLMRYLCQLQAPCGSPQPRSFVSRSSLNVNQPGGGRACQTQSPR